MKQTQWHSSKGNSCRQMTLTKQKLLLEILYTLYVATKTSRIPRKAKWFFRWGIFCFKYPRRRSGKGNFYFANYRFSFRKLQIFISQTTDFHFANYRFPFRKLQIPISQTTDSHFANYRFPFRKLQILISQTTDSHFANYRFPFRKLQISISQTTDFHFVSSHFVSQTTVSRVVTTYSTCVINFSGTDFGYPPHKSCSGAELCAACMLFLYILDEYMKSM